MYSLLEESNENAFLEMAKKTYREINPQGEVPINAGWLLALLVGYDVITKYVYKHEIERKRARFAEALIATHKKQQEFTTASNLLWKQTAQYAITVTDEALMQAYIDTGVKKVRWVTEKDSRVCPVCRARSNKIYPIKLAPKKTHYNCRCYYEAVREGDE
jgi:SPP1 gp7 family putative phage head morphogenesis protein